MKTLFTFLLLLILVLVPESYAYAKLSPSPISMIVATVSTLVFLMWVTMKYRISKAIAFIISLELCWLVFSILNVEIWTTELLIVSALGFVFGYFFVDHPLSISMTIVLCISTILVKSGVFPELLLFMFAILVSFLFSLVTDKLVTWFVEPLIGKGNSLLQLAGSLAGAITFSSVQFWFLFSTIYHTEKNSFKGVDQTLSDLEFWLFSLMILVHGSPQKISADSTLSMSVVTLAMIVGMLITVLYIALAVNKIKVNKGK